MEIDFFCINEFFIVVSMIRIYYYLMNDIKQDSVCIYRIFSDSVRNIKIGEKFCIKIYSEINDEKLFKDFERYFRICKS